MAAHRPANHIDIAPGVRLWELRKHVDSALPAAHAQWRQRAADGSLTGLDCPHAVLNPVAPRGEGPERDALRQLRRTNRNRVLRLEERCGERRRVGQVPDPPTHHPVGL